MQGAVSDVSVSNVSIFSIVHPFFFLTPVRSSAVPSPEARGRHAVGAVVARNWEFISRGMRETSLKVI